jgi:hypothetical protein
MKNNFVRFRHLFKIVFLARILIKIPHFLDGFKKGNSKILTFLEGYKKWGFLSKNLVLGVVFKDG